MPREVWRVGDLVLDEGQQCVARGDEVIELPKLSFDLLLALVRDAPNVVPIDTLLARVWPGLVVNPETVVQRVKLLRDALDDRAAEPRYIAALRGRGYRLVADAVRIDPVQAAQHSPAARVEPSFLLRSLSSLAAPASRGPPSTQAEAGIAGNGEGSLPVPHRWHIMAWSFVAIVLLGVLGVWVVQQRGVPVSPATTFTESPTEDTEARLAWQRGLDLLGRYTAAGADAAAVEFEKAIVRDPEFGAAYAALYDARMQAASLRYEDMDAARRQHRWLLDRAQILEGESGDVLFARAMWEEMDDATREVTFRAAMQRGPDNSRGLTAFAGFLDLVSHRMAAPKLRGLGHFPPRYGLPTPRDDELDAEVTQLLELALEKDASFAPARFLLLDRENAGREPAERRMWDFLEDYPDYYPALHRLARYQWLFHQDPSEAIRLIEQAIDADPDNPLARKAAATFYLDIGDEIAAADVADHTIISRATASPALELYAGNWQSAGLAAQSEETFTFDKFEAHGTPEALRDMALYTRDYTTAESLLVTRYDMSLEGQVRPGLGNFRTWVLLAHLQLLQGQEARAREILEEVIAWIDADRVYGPVYNLRTRAQAEMLLGHPEVARQNLTDSFRDDRDYVEWWYTIERDPIWDAVRESSWFQELAADAQRLAREERDQVEALRREGRIPHRPAATE